MKEQEGTRGAANKQAAVGALKTLEQNRTGIVLTGHVENGKVVLDQSCLEEIAKRFPGSHTSFVAVNAPFDPRSRSLSELAK